MKRVLAVLVVSFLMIFMVAAAAISYLGGSRSLGAIGRNETTLQLALGDGAGSLEAPAFAEARLEVGALGPGALTLLGYRVQNVGASPGLLRIGQITQHNYELGCQAREREAGDLSCGNPGEQEGELKEVLLMRLFRDVACDFVLNAGDQFLYGAAVVALPPMLDINLPVAPGEDVCLIFAFERARSSQLTHGAVAGGDTLDIALMLELSP